MKWKKLVAIGCVVVMAVSSVTACGSNTSDSAVVQEDVTATEAEDANEAVIVQVTAVEGDTITAEVGTLSTANMGGAPSGEAPEGMPESEVSEGTEAGEAPSDDMGEKPEMPEGEASEGMPEGEAPEGMPEGEAPSGDMGERPEMPEGEAPEGMSEGEAPEGMSEGEAPEGMPEGEMTSGGAPSGMPGGSSFESSGETIEFTLTDDTVITIEYLQGSSEGTADDIVLGSVLEIVLDEENQAASGTVKNLNAGGGFGGGIYLYWR